MKQAWLKSTAVIVLLAASSGAFAADLANRTAYPPPPLPPLYPIYNWNGFYLGANLGGAWASGTLKDNVTGASITGNNSGVIGGGTMGYNWQFAPNWVVGVEGTFDGTSISKTTSTINGTYFGVPVSIQGSANTNWVATVAARLGYAVNNWLFYGKGGGGWANNSASVTGVAVTNNFGWVGGTTSASNTMGGWLAGAGIEYGLTQNWTIKAEYDYLGLGNWTTATHFAPGDSFNVSRNINMFTVGANYKF